MANAAAKKAAAKKEQTASVYKPVLILLETFHIILFLYYNPNKTFFSYRQILVNVICWVVLYLAYCSIVTQSSEVHISSKSSKKDASALAGGLYLDIIGLILFVQFSSACLSQKFEWFLIIGPCLYPFLNSDGSKKAKNSKDKENTNANMSGESQEVMDRRKRRAERRSQKKY